TRIAECQPVFGLIHAESARTACAGSEEDVPVDDFLLSESLFFQALQVLHQVAHGKVRRIALAVVPVLLPRLEGSHARRGNRLGKVAKPFERAVNEPLVLPRESAEKQSGPAALLLGKRPLYRALEMVNFGPL